MAIRHVALFTWSEPPAPEWIAQVTRDLAALPAQIPELRSLACGGDLGLTEGTADFAVVAEMDDDAGYRAYRDHPAHRAVAERILAQSAHRMAAQFTV